MLKKIMALFLLTAFTHVYAITPIEQTKAISSELNKTFDELNYKLNVQWDQKDSTFFNQTITDFENEIADLQQQGLTTKDLVHNALDKIKDKQIKNDMNQLSQIINENQMGPQEARDFIISKLNSTYSNGASWSGSRHGMETALIIGAIFVILVLCSQQQNNTTINCTVILFPSPGFDLVNNSSCVQQLR